MIKVVFVGLFGCKFCIVLMVIVIVFGVVMISGMFVFIDLIDKVFSLIFIDVCKGLSVVVSGKFVFDFL